MEKITISGATQVEKMTDHLSMTQQVIAKGGEDMICSDGYHTFDELYEHRITLFIALCKSLVMLWDAQKVGGTEEMVWRSQRHSDGELCFGDGSWFVMGIAKDSGKQITYHLPMIYWENTDFATTLEKAPEWDGHSSQDVLNRLKAM